MDCSTALPIIDRSAIFAAGVAAQKVFEAPTNPRSGSLDKLGIDRLLEGVAGAEALKQFAYQRA
jgi:hypothetical protein